MGTVEIAPVAGRRDLEGPAGGARTGVALGFTLAQGPRDAPAAVLLLSLATVYGQLYYAVDALAGAALAALVLFTGRRAGYDAGAAVRQTTRDPRAHNGAPR